MKIVFHPTSKEATALTKLRDEVFPTFSVDAVARKLMRDALIGAGVLALPAGNRGKGAVRAGRDAMRDMARGS